MTVNKGADGAPADGGDTSTEAEKATVTGADGAPAESGVVTFDAWYQKLPENHRTLVDGHVSPLRNALERQKAANAELKERLSATLASKETDAAAKVAEFQAKLEESNRQTTFYESAVGAGIKNLSLAYMAAKQDGLIKADGTIDAVAMKTKHPELFSVSTPPADAGSGTSSSTPAPTSFNSALRQAFGAR